MAYLEDMPYPSSASIGQRMGLRNFEYFSPQEAQGGILALPLPDAASQPPTQQPTALQQMLQQSAVPEPYNLAERVFLSLGGQGDAVKEDKERYALANYINQTSPNSQQAELLKQAAIKNPQQFGQSYLKMITPDIQLKEVDGQLVRYNANDPRGAAEVVPLGGGTGAPSRKQIAGESDLRKEVDALTKDFRSVKDAYARIEVSAKDPSAAGDLALIFNYMKMLDPGSTVREGEFATAQNAAGIPERLRAQWNKAVEGQRLTPEMRSDFVNRAGSLYGAQAGNYNQVVEQYRGIAGQYGYDQDRIAKKVELNKTPVAPVGNLPKKIINRKTGQIQTLVNGIYQ